MFLGAANIVVIKEFYWFIPDQRCGLKSASLNKEFI
jgi:hypothetical protein